MSFIACFDIGTSAVKALLVDRDGRSRHGLTLPYPPAPATLPAGEQDPADWWAAFRDALARWWAAGVDPGTIAALGFSGQMQDLIALDDAGTPVRPAVLYADARAGAQAAAIEARFGAAAMQARLGNPFNGASVLPKWLHLRETEPAAFARCTRLLFGAKDFIGHRLTGAAACDPTTAATTGLLELDAGGGAGAWAADWLAPLGLDAALLPALRAAGEPLGMVQAAAAAATGLRAGTPVFTGLGDAAAGALGAGVVDAAQCHAYLGTSGWVARVSGQPAPPGLPLFVLPYLGPQRRLLIGPVSNAGAVHRWALGLLDAAAGGDDEAAGRGDDARFAAFEAAVAAAPPQPRLLCLPYLGGERLPVLSERPLGSFTGLSAATTRPMLMRAALEGVALSLRWAFDLLQAPPPAELVVLGGATRSAAWMQILADAFDAPLRVPAAAEWLPALGAAAAVAPALGWAASAEDFAARAAAATPAPPQRVTPAAAGAAMMRAKSPRLRALQAAIAALPEIDD